MFFDGYTYGSFSLTETQENLFNEKEIAMSKVLKRYFDYGIVSYKATQHFAEILIGGIPVGTYLFNEDKIIWKEHR